MEGAVLTGVAGIAIGTVIGMVLDTSIRWEAIGRMQGMADMDDDVNDAVVGIWSQDAHRIYWQTAAEWFHLPILARR